MQRGTGGRECKLNSAGLAIDQARTLARVRSAYSLGQ